MYREITASEYKTIFGFSPDYAVSGFLSYGSWNEPEYLGRLHDILRELKINYTSRRLAGFLGHIDEITVGGRAYWICVLYGGAMLSEYVHLASLFGSRKNIHLGSCGGLDQDIQTLDVLIPSYSFGDESITRMYAKDVEGSRHPADTKLAESLKGRIGNNFKTLSGSVVTNQAMLGETLADIKDWSEKGYAAVEMETSAVFAVSNHFSVPSAAILYIIDNLIKGQTVHGEENLALEERQEEVVHEICRAGLEELLEN